MSTHETLIASLALHGDADNVTTEQGGYIDWSISSGEDQYDEWQLEAGDKEGNAAQLVMTRADMLALHHALTLTLLRDEQ